jgi:type III restriction enzyme
VLTEIEKMAATQEREMEAIIQEQSQQPVDENIFQEMGNKVKRYKMIEANKVLASGIVLPQFFLRVPESGIFGMDNTLLNQESLLKNFKINNQDSKIDFDQISSDLYKIDVELTGTDEYSPRIVKVEDQLLKDPIVEYILARPKENQIKDIAHQLIQMIGDMYPISDPEIRTYIERVLGGLTAEQLQDILARKYSYADKIKARIRQHVDTYAESQFDDMVKTKKIYTEPVWHFPEMIVPGMLGSSITKSLYEREGAMNNFETSVIQDIASLPNIAFWHRNLGRGKGFCINGFKSNHYPDFIAVTTTGKIIIIETKGDDRDNSDSAAKCRLGNTWADKAGDDFFYFMVFDKKDIRGAYNADKAKDLIKKI